MAVLAAALAMVIMLSTADRRGFWLDEYYTLNAASLPTEELMADRIGAGHSPLPFLYAKLFYDHVGTSERALRTSSALAIALAIMGLAGILHQLRLERSPAYIWAMVIAALAPYWYAIGTEFRYMAPLVAVVSFWGWAMAAWLQEATARRGMAVALLGGLALWIHGSAQFVVFGMIGAAVWCTCTDTPKGRRLVVSGQRILPLIVSILLSAPLLLILAEGGPQRSSPGTPDPFDLIQNQANTILTNGRAMEWVTGVSTGPIRLIHMIFYVLAAFGAYRFLRSHRQHAAGSLVAGWLVGQAVGMMLYSMVGDDIQGTLRYAAGISIPVLLVFALGTAEIGNRGVWGRAYQGLLIVYTLCALSVQVVNQGDWHREAIKWLAAQRTPDEPVIMVGKGMNRVAFKYHRFPSEGLIMGMNSNEINTPVVVRTMKKAWQGADSGFLFQYRAHDVPIEDALEILEFTKYIADTRVWEVNEDVRIYGIARTAEGVERINSIPALPMPAISDVSRD